MANPVVLRDLLRDKHWQTYATFCRVYDRAAAEIDESYVGRGPSRAQLHRWTSGDLKGLPYPHHCEVLERMFPGVTAAEMFMPSLRADDSAELGDDDATAQRERATPAPLPSGSPDVSGELVQLFPSRSAVPFEVWRRLIEGARESLDVLVYAATFLFEQHDLGNVIREKSSQGVSVRLLIADETSPAVQLRAEEEGTVGGLQARIQLHRRYLREVEALPGVEVRPHRTTLYNSLFRFDGELLVNGHAYGSLAGESPVMHLRQESDGRLWDHYMRSFDEVWKVSAPAA